MAVAAQPGVAAQVAVRLGVGVHLAAQPCGALHVALSLAGAVAVAHPPGVPRHVPGRFGTRTWCPVGTGGGARSFLD